MEDIDYSFQDASSIYELPKETLEAIRSKTKFEKFKKNECFIKKGEFQKKFFFLVSGIARAYKTDENGKEFTHSLYTPPTAVVSLRSIKTNTKSTFSYDCLTDCEMFVGDYLDFIELTKTNLVISNTYSKMLEKALFHMEERVNELSLSAKEKYELLRKRISNIDNLIPQYQIAAYLNITNVQLSRVRAKMHK